MANRRMFSLDVVNSDTFLDMGAGAQLLYYHLAMRADDDGIIGAPKRIMRECRATDGDMKELIRERYVIAFDSGVIAIAHWLQQNKVRNERYKRTVYVDELSQLGITENETYVLLSEYPKALPVPKRGAKSENVTPPVTPTVRQGVTPSVRQNVTPPVMPSIGKGSVVEESRVEESRGKGSKEKEPKHRYGEFKHVLLTDREYIRFQKDRPNDWQYWIRELDEYLEQHKNKHYDNHNLTMRRWIKNEEKKQASKTPASRQQIMTVQPDEQDEWESVL